MNIAAAVRRRAALLWLLLGACSRAAKEEPVKTDLNELSRLIRWPQRPLHAQWQVLGPAQRAGLGPNDWQLAALLEFDPEDRRRLLAGAQRAAIDPSFAAAFVLPWFPDELRSRFRARPDRSLELLDPPLDAAAFHSPPLSDGFLLPYGGGGWVLLFLYTR